jgi:hypothetical protein
MINLVTSDDMSGTQGWTGAYYCPDNTYKD